MFLQDKKRTVSSLSVYALMQWSWVWFETESLIHRKSLENMNNLNI